MRWYGYRVRLYEEVNNLFNDSFPDRPWVNKSTVFRTVERFQETGMIKDWERPGRPKSASNEEKSLDVRRTFIENPHTSSRGAASDHDITQKSVINILTKNKYHLYKITMVQELAEDIFLQKAWVLWDNNQKTRRKSLNFGFYFVFGWGYLRPSWTHQHILWILERQQFLLDEWTSYTRRPKKVNVWTGMNRYFARSAESSWLDFNTVWFQQDHYNIQVCNRFDHVFPNQWIEDWAKGNGQSEWLLNPLKVSPWGVSRKSVQN